MRDDPELLKQVFRPDNLDKLFGKPFNTMEDSGERTAYALPLLNRLVHLWMIGRPLRDLEVALGVDPEKLKTCDGARKFVLWIVPELAYVFGVPALLKQRAAAVEKGAAIVVPPALAQLRRIPVWCSGRTLQYRR